MTSEVLNFIDGSKEVALKMLEEAVSIPTVNPPGENYKEFCELALSWLREIGLKADVIKVPERYLAKHLPEEWVNYPRYILICRVGSGGEILHLNGHYDVVPPGKGWKTDPFKLFAVDDRVYGRGVADMKGGIISMILTLRAITELNVDLNGVLELSLTPDEEIGGKTGVGFLIQKGITKPNYVIIAEASSRNNVYIGHKGLVWLEVLVKGKQAHGSSPWLGVNAFEGMVRVANRLMNNLKPRVESRVSKFKTIDPRGRRATIMIGGVVKGGVKVNVVPDEVSFTIDRRLIPEESVDEAVDEIRREIESIKDVNCELSVLEKANPCITPLNSKLVTELSNSIEKVLGERPELTMCVGGLDMRYFVEAGADAVAYGPGSAEAAHTANEYIDLSDVLAASKVYALTCLSLLTHQSLNLNIN